MAEVVTYRETWRGEFERLNREWIETWFVLEEADLATFRDPVAKIITPGGQDATTPAGDASTFAEYEKMLRAAGFAQATLQDLRPSPNRVIIASR